MKRAAAASAVFALVLFGAPSPANAAPECGNVDALGLICVEVLDGQAVVKDSLGNVIVSAPVPPVVETVTETVTVTVPGPTVTVPGPTQTITVAPGSPAPSTVTRTVPGPTATVTASPVTVTASPTNTTGGQETVPSDTLSGDTATPTLAQPPPVESGGVDLIPDDPEVAAATGSLLGLFMGIVLGLVGMFIVYRRGQIDGEKATLREFLGIIRGEPATTGRHRFDE